MRSTHVRLACLSLAAVLAGACVGPDDGVLGGDGASDTDLVRGDSKADGDLRARVTGMTVWLSPQVTREERDGGVVWAMRGRASRPIQEAFAFVPDDAFGEATVLTPTTFEVTLGSDHEINTMLSGMPLFVRLVPQSGDGVFAGLWLEPSFTRFSGSSKVYLDSALDPVWVGGQVTYRARASTAAGYDRLDVVAADAAAPVVAAEGTRHWRLDFSFDALGAAAADAAGVTVEAWRGATAARKRVQVRVGVAWLGLTLRDPYEVWAAECDDDVRACLAELEIGDLDAEQCGTYREVARCGGAAVAPEPALDRIVADVRDQLVSYYEWHADAIAAAGGRTLAEAQALVTAASIVRITNPGDDPLHHDLAWEYVYRAPDTTIAGSPAFFYALYERRGGTLETVYFQGPTS